jgi:hypothetical protein
MYLYNRAAVRAGTVERVIERVAPDLGEVADVEIVPTEGLTYYKLKNFGVARSKTEVTIMIDSDAAPQPGWLAALVEPFVDPDVMAVGGFTQMGHDDFLSRAMALSWIFNLADEGTKTEGRNSIHVNNFAVRTQFFQDHPFPDLPTFKKACVFWLRGIKGEGHQYVRTAKAKAIHAPHPGPKFLVWRAWTAGMDADFVTFQTRSSSHVARFAYSFVHFAKKLGRAWYRILFKGGVVGMPLWERPAALLVALTYYLIVLTGQLQSSLTRRFGPIPAFQPMSSNSATRLAGGA